MAFWISALVGTSSRREASGHCGISDKKIHIKARRLVKDSLEVLLPTFKDLRVVSESDTVERLDRCRTSFARTINRLQAVIEGPRVVSVSGCLQFRSFVVPQPILHLTEPELRLMSGLSVSHLLDRAVLVSHPR